MKFPGPTRHNLRSGHYLCASAVPLVSEPYGMGSWLLRAITGREQPQQIVSYSISSSASASSISFVS